MLNLSQVYNQIHDIIMYTFIQCTYDVHTCKVFNTPIFMHNIPFYLSMIVYTCMYMCTNTLCIILCMCIHTTCVHTMYIASNIHVIHFIRMCTCIRTCTCISSMCMDIWSFRTICTSVHVHYVHVYYISGMVSTLKCV